MEYAGSEVRCSADEVDYESDPEGRHNLSQNSKVDYEGSSPQPSLPIKRCSRDGVWHVIRYPDQIGAEEPGSPQGTSAAPSGGKGQLGRKQGFPLHPELSASSSKLVKGMPLIEYQQKSAAVPMAERGFYMESGCQTQELPISGQAGGKQNAGCAEGAALRRSDSAGEGFSDKPCSEECCQAQAVKRRLTACWEKQTQTETQSFPQPSTEPMFQDTYRTGVELPVIYLAAQQQQQKPQPDDSCRRACADFGLQTDSSRTSTAPEEKSTAGKGMANSNGSRSNCIDSGVQAGYPKLGYEPLDASTSSAGSGEAVEVIAPPYGQSQLSEKAAERGIKAAKSFVGRLERDLANAKPVQGEQSSQAKQSPCAHYRYMNDTRGRGDAFGSSKQDPYAMECRLYLRNAPPYCIEYSNSGKN